MIRIALILCLASLTGCNRAVEGQAAEAPPTNDVGLTWANDAQTIFRDDETGCQYLYQSTGITPRLGSDGRPMCDQSETFEGEDQ